MDAIFFKFLSSVTLINTCTEFRKLMICFQKEFLMSFGFSSRFSRVDLIHRRKTYRVEMMDKNTWYSYSVTIFFLNESH